MSDFVSLALAIALPLTLIGLTATCTRLFLGPSRADRVVALDLITVLLAAAAALAALRFDNPAYLDISLTLALIGFLATVAFARYVGLSRSPLAEPGTPDTTSLASPAPLPGIPGVGADVETDEPSASPRGASGEDGRGGAS